MKKILLDFKHGPRHWYRELVQVKMAPREIALGFSVGVFFTTLALPILNLLLVILAMFLLRVNKIAVMLGYVTVLWPLSPFVYYGSMRLGFFLFGYTVEVPEIKEVTYSLIKQYGVAFIAGNLILSAAIAILSFMVVYSIAKLVEILKKRRENSPPADNPT
ncbi:MAG: DUF2062 domain-containing protein [archaeon]